MDKSDEVLSKRMQRIWGHITWSQLTNYKTIWNKLILLMRSVTFFQHVGLAQNKNLEAGVKLG